MKLIRNLALGALLLSICARTADAGSSWSNIAWGVTVGNPQWVALTLETHQNEPLRLQASLSTVILYTSVTGRVIVVRPMGRVLPYGFLGGGLLYTAVGEWDSPDGGTGFYWVGGGLRFRWGAAALFGEAGYYAGMDTSKGYDSAETSYAAGILYEF